VVPIPARSRSLLDAAGPVGQAVGEDLDRKRRRDLAGLRAAHPVGHHEQRRLGEVAVLVDSTQLAGVRQREPLGDAKHQSA
jgi:hypothetical protein